MTTVQSNDLDRALACFARARNRVLEVTKGLSEAQWKFKPAPDRWSIAENLEHMVIVQERVLGPIWEQLAQAPPPPAGSNPSAIDAIVLERIPERSIRAKAPAYIEPTGTWTLASSLERFLRNYQRLIQHVESTPDLRQHASESAPLKYVTNGAYTMMDGYQWALTVASHDERHVRQILEVKADPNYPHEGSVEAAAMA